MKWGGAIYLDALQAHDTGLDKRSSNRGNTFLSNCWSSLNRRFSADEDQGGIGISVDLLESYGDSWGFADEGC